MPESEAHSSHCINCGTEFIGEYCHSCGQKNRVQRLTFRNAWLEFQQFFLGLDTKYFRTFKTIWVNPGRVAKANIDGNRVMFVGPVGYLFVVLTILLLLVSAFGVKWTEFMSESINTFQVDSQQQTEMQTQMMGRIFNNFRAFQFLVIPFMAMGAKLMFRKSNYNYLEHMVVVFYVQAQMVFITILNLFSHVLFDKTFFMLSMPISLLFYGFACLTFYQGKYPLVRFIKGMFVQILGLVFFSLTFLLIVVGVMIFLAATDPEFAEQFKPVQ